MKSTPTRVGAGGNDHHTIANNLISVSEMGVGNMRSSGIGM